MSLPLATLNAVAAEDFVPLLHGIYEHSPWIAERAAALRPFASRFALLDAMQAVVAAATRDAQLGLIRAHPELAGKAAVRGELTAESTREQAHAGLSACSQAEFDRLQALNAAYHARFGFPFILSVKGHDRASILRQFERRAGADPDTELATALREIGRIAEFRLLERVTEPMGASIMARAQRLARHSETAHALTCTFLSEAHQAVARQLRDWMWAAGMDARIDAIGNVVGRWRGTLPDAKTLLTGSHYDTVVDAGAYDGRLGVLLPIVVVEHLRRAGVALPFDLEIIGFSDEEGVRYGSTYLGSRAVAGHFDAALLDRRDREGLSMRDALIAAGLDPDGIAALAREPASVSGYLEVHIEQGPQLLDEGLPVGVVTAINGGRRLRVSITGVAAHAGTVPMSLRHDAATAGAELTLYVERRCSAVPGLVGTVGRLEVPGGAVNVIPGRCELTIDIRAPDDAVRDAAVADIEAEMARIAARRGVVFERQELLNSAATACSPALREALAASVCRVTGSLKARQLASGAGHDAVPISQLTEVGMLFVRCGNGGVSHNPAETLSEADADVAARVFADFLHHHTPR